jgi:hypothetical protein
MEILMEGIALQFDQADRLEQGFDGTETVATVISRLNARLSQFDSLGHVERQFEFNAVINSISPVPNIRNLLWAAIHRPVIIVEADLCEPGIFWLNISSYVMSDYPSEKQGFDSCLHHLATAKVWSRSAAWGLAAHLSHTLSL